MKSPSIGSRRPSDPHCSIRAKMPVICDFEIIYEHGTQSPSVDEPHVEGVAGLSAHGRSRCEPRGSEGAVPGKLADLANLGRSFRGRMKRRVRAGPAAGLNQPGSYQTFMKILLFLRRKPHRRPVIPLAKIRHRLRPRVPKPSSGAQVETPQRVAPQAGFFYR